MFAEDLSIFFEDFGIDVVFTRAAAPVATAKLILNAPASEIAVYDRSFYDEKFYEARATGAKIELHGIATELLSVEQNDTATINGFDYRVFDIQPDGTGLMDVVLSIHSV